MKFQMCPSVPLGKSFLLCGPQAPLVKRAVWFEGLFSPTLGYYGMLSFQSPFRLLPPLCPEPNLDLVPCPILKIRKPRLGGKLLPKSTRLNSIRARIPRPSWLPPCPVLLPPRPDCVLGCPGAGPGIGMEGSRVKAWGRGPEVVLTLLAQPRPWELRSPTR